MKSIVIRIVLTILAIMVFSSANTILHPASMVLAGDIAGNQFDNSNVSFITTMAGMSFFSHLGLPLILFFGVLGAIWFSAIRKFFAALAVMALLFSVHPAWAYYNQSNYAEVYSILPNQSAIWIPNAGDTKDNQVQEDTESFYKANKVSGKYFFIPHVKLPDSGFWNNYFVPAGRLIIVDRTPYTRHWVSSVDRGTSLKNEGIVCQSKEGINIATGISIGVEVKDEDAARYLAHFGVVSPQGNATDPNVIFTSVYYSRKLEDVMDTNGFAQIHALICDQFSGQSFDADNADADQIMDSVKKEATAYLQSVGITLDFIGWGDTFTFDPTIQNAINRRYVAEQDQQIANKLEPYANTIQALAAAEALRSFAGKSDGKLPTSMTTVGAPPNIASLLTGLFKINVPPTAPAMR